MRHSRLIAAAVLCVAFLPAAFAQDQNNIIRGGIFLSRPRGSLHEAGVVFDPEQAFGLRVSYERKLSHALGVAAGLATVEYDIQVKIDALEFDGKFADERAMPLTAAVFYHPSPTGKVDVYVGGGPAYVRFADATVERGFGGGQILAKNDFTWHVQGGLDIKLDDTGKWRGNVDLQYIDMADNELEIKPINLGMGLSLRF